MRLSLLDFDWPHQELLQGSYTRLLHFVRNIPFEDHPTMSDIYGDIPSVLAQVTQQRLRLLDCAYRPDSHCPQILADVLSWLLSERLPSPSAGLFRPFQAQSNLRLRVPTPY